MEASSTVYFITTHQCFLNTIFGVVTTVILCCGLCSVKILAGTLGYVQQLLSVLVASLVFHVYPNLGSISALNPDCCAETLPVFPSSGRH